MAMSIEQMRNESGWSSQHGASTFIVHPTPGRQPPNAVYDEGATPARPRNWKDWLKKLCQCRESSGFLILLFFLVFLGVVITAAILIFIFAVPGTQTLPLVLEGNAIEMIIPNMTWPLETETDDNTLMVLTPSHLQQCVGFGFSCTSRPDEVVATNQRCDGVADCGDNSDETFCKTCLTRYWCPPRKDVPESKRAANKICLTAAQICDGVPHCPGGWDETHFCKKACLETEFACVKSGINGLQKCLSRDVMCDGVKDCPKGDDEEGCDKCSHGSKLCKADRKCIPKGQLCDGKKDCSDGSDEQECDCVKCSGRGKTLCEDGTCIMSTQVCDGIADCTKGIDELKCINGKPMSNGRP